MTLFKKLFEEAVLYGKIDIVKLLHEKYEANFDRGFYFSQMMVSALNTRSHHDKKPQPAMALYLYGLLDYGHQFRYDKKVEYFILKAALEREDKTTFLEALKTNENFTAVLPKIIENYFFSLLEKDAWGILFLAMNFPREVDALSQRKSGFHLHDGKDAIACGANSKAATEYLEHWEKQDALIVGTLNDA